MMLGEPACEGPFGRRKRQHGTSAGDQKQVGQTALCEPPQRTRPAEHYSMACAYDVGPRRHQLERIRVVAEQIVRMA